MELSQATEWREIWAHPSAMPAAAEAELAAGLRAREINPKFLYQTRKQARLWLELHLKHAPSAWPGISCFADHVGKPRTVVGLSVGPGLKERALLETLASGGNRADFLAVDVSIELLLLALENTRAAAAGQRAALVDTAGWSELRERFSLRGPLLLTFFGTVHNFIPTEIFQKLAGAMESGDLLLLSANLAPGQDYEEAVRRVFAQYENPSTERWLRAFFQEQGVEGGTVTIEIEECPAGSGLRRIAGSHVLSERVELTIGQQRISFEAGESLRLFFSYRYSVSALERLAGAHGLELVKSATNDSGEEGLFLLRKQK